MKETMDNLHTANESLHGRLLVEVGEGDTRAMIFRRPNEAEDTLVAATRVGFKLITDGPTETKQPGRTIKEVSNVLRTIDGNAFQDKLMDKRDQGYAGNGTLAARVWDAGESKQFIFASQSLNQEINPHFKEWFTMADGGRNSALTDEIVHRNVEQAKKEADEVNRQADEQRQAMEANMNTAQSLNTMLSEAGLVTPPVQTDSSTTS